MKPTPLQPSALFLDPVIPHLLQPLHTSAWGFKTLSFLLLFYWVGQKFHSFMEEAKWTFWPTQYYIQDSASLCEGLSAWLLPSFIASLLPKSYVASMPLKSRLYYETGCPLGLWLGKSHCLYQTPPKIWLQKETDFTTSYLNLIKHLALFSLNLFLLFTGRSLFCFG